MLRHFNCVITEAHWEQTENQLIFTIKADRFLAQYGAKY